MQNLEIKIIRLAKIYGKIKIFSTHNFRCQKLATINQKNSVKNLQF